MEVVGGGRAWPQVDGGVKEPPYGAVAVWQICQMRRLTTCPRCGELGYGPYERRRGSGSYLYVVHVEGGRRRECYIGPRERYEYFNRVEELSLRGLYDHTRHLDYVRSAVLGLVNEASTLLRQGKVEEALRLVEGLLKLLDEARVKLGNVKAAIWQICQVKGKPTLKA